MFATDVGFLLYWGITATATLGVIGLPAEWLFADYHDSTVVAWNWSFLPLDVLLSATGLYSLRLSLRGDQRWRPLAVVSLAMTFCAGLMAISFWAIRSDYSLVWWGFNLFLMTYPLPFVFGLINTKIEQTKQASRKYTG